MKEKEANELLSEFAKIARTNIQQLSTIKPPIELTRINDEEIFLVGGEPVFAKSGGRLFPTLLSAKLLTSMPKVIVNMGAVPYVCNGADVMAPGIVRFEGDFNREEFVVICDERHQKPIAITVALYSSEEAKKLKHGKILRTIHYVGDRLWNAMKQLSQAK
jgi:PUA domain protein